MNKKIKTYQLSFILMLVLSVGYTVLSFAHFLPTDYIGNHPRVLYWINLYSIVTGFGGMYVFLRWFHFRSIGTSVKKGNREEGFSSFCFWTKFRLFLLAVVLLSNTVLYHASSYTETPKYCMLVTYIACVFCWPSLSAFVSLRSEDESMGESKVEG